MFIKKNVLKTHTQESKGYVTSLVEPSDVHRKKYNNKNSSVVFHSKALAQISEAASSEGRRRFAATGTIRGQQNQQKNGKKIVQVVVIVVSPLIMETSEKVTKTEFLLRVYSENLRPSKILRIS